ncbi:FecCD family ABC transporter permease [Treponema saccharophilum]|nr:iron ABC transporter permease [Treponema saccharophilum]
MKNGKNHTIKIALIFLIVITSSFVSLFLFPTRIDFAMERGRLTHVLMNIRLPEILIAITAGACLGLAGAIMQVILDNSLASPFTLGISAASAFGAAVSICLELNIGILWLSPGITAFVCSLISMFLLIFLSSLSGINKKNIILIGLALNFFFNAANTFLQYFSTPDAVYQITFWTTGSLTTATLKDSLVLAGILVCSIVVSILFSKDLGLIQQGERTAVMYGVNVNFERILFLLICSLLASSTVSVVGIIGFIGLVAPHISRLLKLESPKLLLLSSMLIGSALLVIADIFSKTILHPTILPISAITSLFGIPLLIFLLFFRRNR